MSALRFILWGAAAGAVIALATSKTGRQFFSTLVDEYGDKVGEIADVVKNNANKFVKRSVTDATEKLAI